MAARRVLMACPNYWHSPFQVGSHHLARRLARAGWDVAYLSDPISPLHLAYGLTPDLCRRLAIYQAGGEDDLDGRLWTYLPVTLLSPHGKPVLKSMPVHRYWHRWTWPNVVQQVRGRGFGQVDLLYIDSVHQSFWLDRVDYRQSVYRVADYNPQFPKYTAATRVIEQEVARRVDLVVVPSAQLEGYAHELGARRVLCLPNGVDYDHFAAGPWPEPPEYRGLSRPIAVYVGVMPRWFHFDWVRQAARRLPKTSFVLIGNAALARQELAGLPNVRVLGPRSYELVPAYLQHANVGLMPFNPDSDRRTVEVLNPQKLYAYLAAGLPVVSSDWEALRQLSPPVRRCGNVDGFVEAIHAAGQERCDVQAQRRFAAQHDWQGRLDTLLAVLQSLRDSDHADLRRSA